MSRENLDLSEEENSNIINNSYERYLVKSIDIINSDENNLIINNDTESKSIKYFKKDSKSKIKFPFMVYILIFTLILFLSTLLALIIISSTYKENYKYEENIYLKPSISEHNYSRLIFDNDLEIILTQIHYNDTAAGVMTFDSGYLDPQYDPGFLKLAFLSLRHNDRDNMRYLNEYMGNLNQITEEFYSSTYFTILNSGFQNFLKNFKNYTNYSLAENITQHINRRINMLPEITSFLNNVNEREAHLIEYLVYNITDEKGNDVWRQGIKEQLRKKLNNNTDMIINITKGLFNPKKIKMLFSSRYKMSLMRKYILRYFYNLTTMRKREGKKEDNKFYSKLNTNKIIYHQIKRNESNYIKINYYLENNETNLDQLYIDSGYLNYIKYILAETHEDSLYYKLTHQINGEGVNIKELSTDFEVVLKKYIRFSILIKLNEYSYNNTKGIIEIVYNYMEKIKAHINKTNEDDERVEELYYITEQNFSFAEDAHEGQYYKNKAKDLFYRDNHDYFLKETWLPQDFKNNFSKIKDYINQLKMEKSVVIIGINEFTIGKYRLNNSNYSFIFHNITKTTNYSNISYSIHDLDKLEIKINNDKEVPLSNHTNKFISKYSKDNKITKGEDTIYGDYKPLKAINDNNHLIEFYWLKDTSFGIPKVYVNLLFFHPFLRPNQTEQTSEIDNLFFHIMIYLAYLQREINLALADAIRAGNIFKVSFNENTFYIDIFAYSDQVEKILEIIKEKIVLNKEEVINETNFAIYRDYALEEFLNFDKVDVKEKLKLKFYKFLTENITDFPPIYNYYHFSKYNFENITIKEIKSLSLLKAPIIRGFILGYYEESEAQKIFDLFSHNYPYNNLEPALMEAKYCISEINPNNFIKSCLYRPDGRDKKVVEDNTPEILNGRTYSFIHFSYYTYESRIAVELLRKIFQQERGYRVETINQRKIYLRISFQKGEYSNTTNIIDTIIDELTKRENIYTEEVDVVGDRYYYIKNNVECEYSKNPYTMRDTAISFSSNFLYRIFDEINDFDYYIGKDYNKFKEAIIDILKKKKNIYYELSNQKK